MELAGRAFDLRTEISGELASALAAVIEASGDGRCRYDARVRRTLVQVIAARAYGRPLLELAILVGAADRLSGRGGYIGYFWGVRNATAGAFKAMASAGQRRRSDPDVLVEPNELVVRAIVPEFRISFGRIPFLAALLEFCVTALGFETVDGEIAKFLQSSRKREDAQELANALSRQLYEFLRQHLPSQQYERKFNTICGFLGGRTGRRPTADSVDDRTVLDFWEDRCAQRGAGGDFRGFRTVAVDCLRLRAALKTAASRQAIDRAAPIGPSRDRGEVDPEHVLDALEAIESERAVLSELAAPPSNRLKTVNKREAARLELVLEAGEAAGLLPLTILRAEVFGAHQARITQAIRKDRHANVGMRPDELIHAIPNQSYATVLEDYRAIAAHLWKMRAALMYILFRNLKAEALTIAFALYPDTAPALKASVLGTDPDVGNVVALRPEQAVAALIARAVSEDPETVPEAALFRRARSAFVKTNRRGFDEKRVLEPGIVEAAEASSPLLGACSGELQTLLKALSRHFDLIPADQAFAEDCRRFQAALGMLYRESA